MMTETRNSLLKSIALTGGTIVCCLTIIFISLHAIYPSTAATAKFLGYVLVFNMLPGLVVTRLLLPGAKEVGVYLIFSLGVGVVANVLAVTALWSIGQLQFLFLLPIVAAGIAKARFSRLEKSGFDWKIGSNGLWAICGTLLACFTGLLGVGLILSGTNGSFSFHQAFQGVIIRGLEFGWPPPNLMFPGAPWSYNYAAHLWLLGVKLMTGLPIEVLVTRYGPAFLGAASAAFIAAFGRYVVGYVWWIATLPVVCVYWVIGIPPVAGAVFASFMPYGANLILSPFLAIIIFFLALAFVLENGNAAPSRLLRIAALITIAFLATGARGVSTPILLCALALRLVVHIWRRDKLFCETAVDLVAAAVGFAAGLRFFFTVGTGFSGAGALKFTGQPFSFLASPDQTVLTLARSLVELGVAAIPAGVIAFAVIAVFQAAFLTPAVPTYFSEIRRRVTDADILLIGSVLAGISGFFLTEAPGLSHISFLYFSSISCSILGGVGLQHMIYGADPRPLWRQGIRSAVLALIILLACLHLAQLPVQTIIWIGNHWSASAASVAHLSSDSLPSWYSCMRDEDANLFARAGRASPKAVVIVLPGVDTCGSTWWVVQHPTQTLNPYALVYVPGRATESELQNKISAQQEHLFHAGTSVAKGVLDVPDLIALAKTLNDRGPVFVMAPRGLSVQANTRLLLVDSNDTLSLWQVSVSRDDE